MLLTDLDDDILIYVISFLHPMRIPILRKTCKRMYQLTQLRIVWTNACMHYITGRGYPFPDVILDTLPVRELERHVCHAAHLAAKWLSWNWIPVRKWFIDATMNTSIAGVRIMPGSEGSIILTLSNTVWSVLTVWKLEPVNSKTANDKCMYRKCCEWSPKTDLFTGFAVNSCPFSKAKLAISAANNGNQRVEILSLDTQMESGDWSLHSIMSIPSTLVPITLHGDLLAMSDNLSETIIFNWKTRAYATLRHVPDGQGIWQHDNCIQVVFAFQSILVVRARSLHLFPHPTLKLREEGPLQYSPISRHSFGWIDGVSVTIKDQHPESLSAGLENPPQWKPLSVLVRIETDDPWSSNKFNIELYTLHPNANYAPSEQGFDSSAAGTEADTRPLDPTLAPYNFPPVLTSRVSSRRGALRCTDIIMGRLGTAVWIEPRDRSARGLYWSMDEIPLINQHIPRSTRENESLAATVFPGSRLLQEDDMRGDERVADGSSENESRVLSWNEQNNWSCVDYAEDVGRIVLGSGFGSITVIDL